MCYHPAMDKDDDAPRPIPAEWLEVIDESDADLAAGRIVPLATVRTELRASIARLEAQLANQSNPPEPEPQHGAVPHRT